MSIHIEVIAIGNEVLNGFTVNTNAALIGQALLGIGIPVTSQRTLGDNRDSIVKGLRASMQENDLIICTGGLGPTCDDLTRQYIAEVFDCELHYEQEIADFLHKNHKKQSSTIDNQAVIPTKARFILNQLGSSSALIFEEHDKLIIFLPGVPAELKHFIHRDIIPLLMNKFHHVNRELRQECFFMQLSEADVDPVLRDLKDKYPEVEFGIYPNLGIISVHIISNLPTTEENLMYQEPIKRSLINSFKENFFSDVTNDIGRIVCELCIRFDLSISVNEHSSSLHLRSRLSPVLETKTGNISVEISGIPDLKADEKIYENEVTITIQTKDQAKHTCTFEVRGNKSMFATKCDHLALAEILKFIRKLTNTSS